MSIRKQYSLRPSDQNSDQNSGRNSGRKSACAHCEGIIHHELWCATQSAIVQYALIACGDPNQLSIEDELILHGLGVTWKAENTQPKLRRLK